MNALEVPRQLLLRSLDWLRHPAANEREEDVAQARLDCAAREVRALPRFMLLTQSSGGHPDHIAAALGGCNHSLVNLIAMAVRRRNSFSDDELGSCFGLLNAYRRAYPSSSRASA